jgi:hypothetical protein
MRKPPSLSVHAIEVAEEGVKRLGMLEVLVEQLLAVGDIAGLDGQHVGGDDRVERVVRDRRVVRCRHRLLPIHGIVRTWLLRRWNRPIW